MNLSHYKVESLLILVLLPMSFVGIYLNSYYPGVSVLGLLWLFQLIHSVVLFFNFWKKPIIRILVIWYWLGITAFYLLGSGYKIDLFSGNFLEKMAKLTFHLILIFYLWFITRYISKNASESE